MVTVLYAVWCFPCLYWDRVRNKKMWLHILWLCDFDTYYKIWVKFSVATYWNEGKGMITKWKQHNSFIHHNYFDVLSISSKKLWEEIQYNIHRKTSENCCESYISQIENYDDVGDKIPNFTTFLIGMYLICHVLTHPKHRIECGQNL